MRVTVGVSPYGCSVEAKKLRDPQGISSSNVIVSITDHSHTFLFRDPEGSPLKIAIKVYYVKSMGIKSDDTVLLSEHIIISYRLWH